MKKLIVLLALIAIAFAAPAPKIPEEDELSEPAYNATYFTDLRRPVGFGGNTRGGAGGAVFTVFDPWALRDALNNNNPRIVYLRGRVDVTALFVSSPGVRLRIGSYTSLIGGERNAEIFGGGVVVSGVRHVIIENIKIFNALSYRDGERPNGNGGIANLQPHDFSTIDNIGIDRDSEHVWVNHCSFADDPWVAGVGWRRHDGLIDITRGANLVTISNSLFRNHVFTSLVGNGADAAQPAGRLKVTWFANWFRGTGQRNPYVTAAENHILNNLYTDIVDFGIGAGSSSSVYVERNVFVNCRRHRGAISSNHANNRGQLYNLRNVFNNCSFDTNLPSNVRWNPGQYYNYRAIPMGDVEAHVRRYAGVRR